MEDELGAAIGLFAGGANQSDRAYRGTAGGKVRNLRSGESRDTKHAVALKGLRQHLLVARLEDVEWQGTVWEEGAVREQHGAQFLGEAEGCQG